MLGCMQRIRIIWSFGFHMVKIEYKHTQIGYLILFVLTLFITFFATLLASIEFYLRTLPILIFLIFILTSFLTLSVKIDKNNLQVKFGYGIYKKSFSIRKIVSVRRVKNH